MNAPVKAPDGLLKIGYVSNLKNGVYIKELQELLNDTDQDPTSQDLRERATNAEIILLNRHGYPKDAAGKAVPESKAKFKAFKTGYTLGGNDVYGWFEKGEKDNFVGVTWGTIQELRAYARLREKTAYLFKMGNFCFENIDDCQTFLEDIVEATIPESWRYKNKDTIIKHPILKSYLETLFSRLKKEEKVLKSKDGKYIIFNTNLLDKFFHAMYIIAEVQEAEGLEVYFHPIRTAEESYTTLKKYGFEDVHPEPPKFFEEVDEVVFNTSWKIEKEHNSLKHIIEQRIDRFPANMRGQDSYVLAKKLYDAIDYALAIAQRNYKYIIPIYYPKFDRISFLMPIFLDGTYNTYPDFALVLETDAENKIYIARTILDLETGYQDARLIAKPDESWLNPITLK
nr:MAG TPA: protein of unknown function DUF3825 [Caudoviricetes sp.]